jgi:hypothetical protein
VGALYENTLKSQYTPCFSSQNSYITGHMQQTNIIDEILFSLAKNSKILTKE